MNEISDDIMVRSREEVTKQFAEAIAKVMDSLRSSHIYSIVQEAYKDIYSDLEWSDVQVILDKILGKRPLPDGVVGTPELEERLMADKENRIHGACAVCGKSVGPRYYCWGCHRFICGDHLDEHHKVFEHDQITSKAKR